MTDVLDDPDRFSLEHGGALACALVNVTKTLTFHQLQAAGVPLAELTPRERSLIARALAEAVWVVSNELLNGPYAVLAFSALLNGERSR